MSHIHLKSCHHWKQYKLQWKFPPHLSGGTANMNIWWNSELQPRSLEFSFGSGNEASTSFPEPKERSRERGCSSFCSCCCFLSFNSQRLLSLCCCCLSCNTQWLVHLSCEHVCTVNLVWFQGGHASGFKNVKDQAYSSDTRLFQVRATGSNARIVEVTR